MRIGENINKATSKADYKSFVFKSKVFLLFDFYQRDGLYSKIVVSFKQGAMICLLY